jgi:hypothetical protein
MIILYKTQAFQTETVMTIHPSSTNELSAKTYIVNNLMVITVTYNSKRLNNARSLLHGKAKDYITTGTLLNTYVHTCILQGLHNKNYWLLKSEPASQSYDQRSLCSIEIRYQKPTAQIRNQNSHQRILLCWIPSSRQLHRSIWIEKHTQDGILPKHGNITTTKWRCQQSLSPSDKCKKDSQEQHTRQCLQNEVVSLPPRDYWIQTPPAPPTPHCNTRSTPKSECPQSH